MKKRTPMLLQLAVIILLSVVASYTFQHTKTVYEINGLCIYRYIAYSTTVFLGYICFSQFKKYIGLSFSIVLSVLAFSPPGQKMIELFPLLVPFLAVLMGVATVLFNPKARGRGFIEFIVMLILPAVLAVSQIGGSSRLLATTESIGKYELSAIVPIIIGGYLYLRYATLANLSSLEFLSNGGREEDVAEVGRWHNVVIITVTLGASGIAAFLTANALIVADVLRAAIAVPPPYVLLFAMGTGMVIVTIFHISHFLTRHQTNM